jgi:hypothetical protein
MMSRYNYDYVRSTYGVDPWPGQIVTHTVTGKAGKVAHAGSVGHYVMVRFDGQKHASPCHPTELKYEARALAKENENAE